MPVSDRRKNQASPPRATATTTRARTWSPVKMKGNRLKRKWKGVLKVVRGWRWAKREGSPISNPPRTWAMPMVATVRIRRGALKKRRITTTSMSHPVTRAAARPMGRARKYETCQPVTMTTAMAAARPPMSAWAKLMMRLDR